MKPHSRIDPIGRVCMICGRGQRPRLGGCFGFGPALRALGYEWDSNKQIGFAHVSCVGRAQMKVAHGESEIASLGPLADAIRNFRRK